MNIHYKEHLMNDGNWVRTYHIDDEIIPSVLEIKEQYENDNIEHWHFIIEPNKETACLTIENYSVCDTVQSIDVELVNWIKEEMGA